MLGLAWVLFWLSASWSIIKKGINSTHSCVVERGVELQHIPEPVHYTHRTPATLLKTQDAGSIAAATTECRFLWGIFCLFVCLFAVVLVCLLAADDDQWKGRMFSMCVCVVVAHRFGEEEDMTNEKT